MAGFDTEDDGEGNPFLWCIVHGEGKWGCRSRGEFLQYLANLSDAKRAKGITVEAWATNLEYDLCNVFDRERIQEVFLRFGRSALVGARWHGVEFRDTIRHVPASVAELGDMVGLKKLESGLFRRGITPDLNDARTLRRYRTRCERDAAITYRFARELHTTFGRLRTAPRMTLASTALRIWQERYWKREVHRPSQEVWQAALEAYHGGRTEAFAVGDFVDVQAIDVASMFPWAMVSERLPLPWGLYRRVGKGADILPFGIYRVDVRSEIERPRLPVRTPKGTVFPNGRFSGWYVGEELLSAISAGVKARVLSGFEFAEVCRPFDGYVRAMFRRKQKSRGITRTIWKLCLNALYGKMAQQGKLVRAVPLDKFMALPDAPLTWREWNGLAIFSEDGIPPPWGNNVWPAFVTARARIKLADEIDAIAASGGRPLYCDTDSVYFQGGSRRYRKDARKPGEFESRGRFSKMLLVGKKEYALQERGKRSWTSHAKGVPFSERFGYLRDGVAEFSRPTRIREAARDGSRVNVWRRVRKVRRYDNRKRASRADGALPTPRISAGRLESAGED